MKKLILVVIMSFGVVGNLTAMEPKEQEEQEVQPGYFKIQTIDNKKFIISAELAVRIPTIQDMIRTGQIEKRTIIFRSISGPSFQRVLDALALKTDDERLTFINQLNNDDLIQFVQVVNFLGIIPLRSELLKNLATRLKNHPELFDVILNSLPLSLIAPFWRQHPAYNHIVNSSVTTLDYEPQSVDGVIVSSDGSMLISWFNKRGIIKIWDMNDLGKQLGELEHPGVSGVIVNLAARKLISWSRELGTIKIWDMDDLEHQLIELPHLLVEGCIFMNFDESKFISWSGGEDGLINIWDMNELGEILNHIGPMALYGVIISSDDSKLTSWSQVDETIKIWDMNNWDLQHELPHGRVTKVIISPDNSKLISYSDDYEIVKTWDMSKLDQPLITMVYDGLKGMVVSSDSTKLILCAWVRGEIKILDINDLKHVVGRLDYPQVSGIALNNDMLASWSWQTGLIKIWNMNNWDYVLYELDHPRVIKVIVNDHTNRVVSWSKDAGTIKVWNMDVLDQLETLDVDQIKFVIWLYENKDKEDVDLTDWLSVYQSLPAQLQNFIKTLFSHLIKQ